MPGLNRTWEAIRRFFVPDHAAVSADSDPVRINGAAHALRTGGRHLIRLCRRFKAQLEDTRRDGERARLDALRRERRAKRRALTLLLRLMSPAQRQEFRRYRYFHVIGGNSGERYRIRIDMIANIDVLRSDGLVRYRLCVRPTGDIPVYDVMAAQLLHLQDAEAEERFLRMANIHSTLPEDHVSLRSNWLS